MQMLGGARCQFNTRTFTNDMTTFTSKDDVLTLLVHLGYLTFDFDTQEVYIPNEEIRSECSEVIRTVEPSRQLLETTLQGVKIETINQ